MLKTQTTYSQRTRKAKSSDQICYSRSSKFSYSDLIRGQEEGTVQIEAKVAFITGKLAKKETKGVMK